MADLYGAIALGLLSAILGGTKTQISGPTGPMTVVSASFIAMAIAIFISCLGLFGLASFMAERRTKENGIRKTNGATTRNILGLLSVDFTKWVLLANLFAWPRLVFMPSGQAGRIRACHSGMNARAVNG